MSCRSPQLTDGFVRGNLFLLQEPIASPLEVPKSLKKLLITPVLEAVHFPIAVASSTSPLLCVTKCLPEQPTLAVLAVRYCGRVCTHGPQRLQDRAICVRVHQHLVDCAAHVCHAGLGPIDVAVLASLPTVSASARQLARICWGLLGECYLSSLLLMWQCLRCSSSIVSSATVK